MRFDKNNRIPYEDFEDGEMWIGIPSGIDYCVDLYDDSTLRLTPAGESDFYGEGTIFVTSRQVLRRAKREGALNVLES